MSLALEARRVEGLVEHPARGADERFAAPVLLVARLLADEQDRRLRRTFPEHRLLGVPVQVAPAAAAGGSTQMIEVAVLGQILFGTHVRGVPHRMGAHTCRRLGPHASATRWG